MSLSLQVEAGKFWPATHWPCQSEGIGMPVPPAKGVLSGQMPVPPAKAVLSGQMPVSTTPTTTPAPAFFAPPSCDQRPPDLLRPRNSGEYVVSTWRGSSRSRVATSDDFDSSVA